MIKNFKSKKLKLFFEKGDGSKLPVFDRRKIKRILSMLNTATCPTDMNLPGWDFHSLQGNLKGYYSVGVRANWKIIFRFESKKVLGVDYLDYH